MNPAAWLHRWKSGRLILSWFDARSQREQMLLVSAGFIAALALAFVAVWRPLVQYRDNAISEVERHDMVLAHVRLAGSSLDPGVAPQTERLSLADSAAANGLLIQRIEPDAEQTRVVLADVPFSGLVMWLDELETTGSANLVAIEIERRPSPGVVSASVTLEVF